MFVEIVFSQVHVLVAVPSVRAVEYVCLQSLACCLDRGFESHRGYGCFSVVIFVCCQLEVCRL